MARSYTDGERTVTFGVYDGDLFSAVDLPDRDGYCHHCSRQNFQAMLHGIEQRAAEGVTPEPLAKALGIPAAQVNVALEFLKERGCIVTRRRRYYPASDALYEDGMTEYSYLASIS